MILSSDDPDQVGDRIWITRPAIIRRRTARIWGDRCFYTLTSADAFPYTINPIRSSKDQAIIRGKRAAWAHHGPQPCLMLPDWSGGYTSIFALQQKEERAAA